MIIQYITDGIIDAPMVRIYNYDDKELLEFYNSISEVANSHVESSLVKGSSQSDTGSGVELELIAGSEKSIVLDKNVIRWTNSRRDWKLVQYMIFPFLNNESNGDIHQWLSGPQAIGDLSSNAMPIVITSSLCGCW